MWQEFLGNSIRDIIEVALSSLGSLTRLTSAPKGSQRPLYLYNTLLKEKQLFTLPPNVRSVRMYNCGPTVYDRQHIGNLSAAVFADVLRRTLESNGYSVKQVINITDFGHLSGDNDGDPDTGEDKMTKGLKREKLPITMENMREFATKYMNLYLADIKALNVATERIKFPRASDYVPGQIAMVQALVEKGYAYETSDGVYFDTSRFPDYGALGGIDLTGLKEGSSDDTSGGKGARIAANAEKRHPTDFAIWKKVAGASTSKKSPKSKKLGWDSPWGVGFPGWHIECSAMINSILGKQIDIHTGGIEHISIHHNNEIAQSEAATGKHPFSRFWMHRAHIQMDGSKLSKSTGNTAYLSDLDDHRIHSVALRYWFLTSHYRTATNFTWEAVEAAQQAWMRLQQRMQTVRAEPIAKTPAEFERLFTERMNDDLDTPGAIAIMWEAVKNTDNSPAQIKAILTFVDAALALSLVNPDETTRALMTASHGIIVESLPDDIQTLIRERTSARENKDWSKADILRDSLKQKGYEVKDGITGIEIFKVN